mmetsp:Transcript_26126/g.85830  ORF Transcript_26126/g.85830 Transcript_26126/m.85830 type:complete len:262 (-) Transcript_26126:525-1310(-)
MSLISRACLTSPRATSGASRRSVPARKSVVVGRRSSLVQGQRAGTALVAPVRAASLSGSGSSGDGGASAWQVLGVAEGADSEQVRQAYNRKKLGASEAEIEKYEAAYNTLLMQQLTMRMQGKAGSGESLASDVRFADRMVLPAPLAKRIPRLDRALTKRFFLINTVCYCLFTLMMLQDARGQEPLMLATGTFFFRLFLKLMGDQSKGSGEPMEEKKKTRAAKLRARVPLHLWRARDWHHRINLRPRAARPNFRDHLAALGL